MIRPSVRAPVIHLDADGEHVCSLMEWGFVRQWKNEAGKPTLHRLFNVRSETIDSKPTFAPAYRRTRAIIPASGYYELPEKGVRIRITKRDGDLLAFAGLWETALHPQTGEEITAFTMAMTNGNGFAAAFHDRMPCLLEDIAFKAWLDPERVAARGLTAGDIARAVREQNVQVAAGQIGQPPVDQELAFQYSVNTQGRLVDAEQFGEIITNDVNVAKAARELEQRAAEKGRRRKGLRRVQSLHMWHHPHSGTDD